MTRIAREIAPAYSHHIIQRGNNRAKIFSALETRMKYLDILRDYSQRYNVAVLAYCLMSNHVHLLVKPHQVESLAKMMQGLSQAYAK
jgi:putative transposase